MAENVFVQLFLLTEADVAQGTFVDSLSEVSHLVQLQHMVVAERFATNIAGVGFLFGVGSDVDLQLLVASE